MRKLLILLLISISFKTFGCYCGPIPFMEKYQRSEFIATAKILEVIQDDKNEDYHDIKIALINVYKGKPITTLKIISALNTTCSFLPPENSTWLIFASTDSKGFLSFASCSGSLQIDRQFNLSEYPNLDKKYKNSINLKLEALSYLEKNKILTVNEFNLITNDYRICSNDLKGFNEKNKFAIYEVKVKQDLSIRNIKVLKKFDSKELSKSLTKCLKDSLEINTKNLKVIPVKTKLILIYFYYPADGKNQSFITTWDF